MQSSHLVQRLTAIQQSLMAQHAGSIALPSAVAGSERETFVREFLQKVFPAHRRFTSGVITDASGTLSGQVDVAIEYGFLPSFPMPSTEDRLLLAESVALVIEVKSDLSAQWTEVESTTEKIKRLRREIEGVTIVGDPGPPLSIPAIAVGYAGHRTVDGLSKRLNSTNVNCRPDGALVIDSGCFVGFGMTATGAFGLFALVLSIDVVLRQLVTARPNLVRYVNADG